MPLGSYLIKIGGAFRRVLHLLARPVRVDSGGEGVVIHPYRGYGSRKEVFLVGRILRQGKTSPRDGRETLARDLFDAGRRILRKGLGGITLTAGFGGARQKVVTDRNGYFRVHLHPERFSANDRLWHHMDLELTDPGRARAKGAFFVPPETARFVVISDIDDTIVFTGVADKLKMLWRLFMLKAESRVAFPGVASFYRALHQGNDRTELNPMLYVSRGPWSIYEVLDEFFRIHAIPVGPILFLRDWGISPSHPFPDRGKGHKLELIQRMLALYRDLPFILIGDSGQHDPEIYARVVRENPDRVLAVYIRNISRDPGRDKDITALADEVAAAGSTLLLAADSFAMAEHAAGRGLITLTALDEVLQERLDQEGETNLKPVRRVEQSGQKKATDELQTVLEEKNRTGSAVNITVERKEAQEPPRKQP
ncbi:MAG: phosphatase domain-containing protein [Desulfobulbaceae bacterium]|nr:phosphatase domain-containing protein [Desulfobulbaceae bacterium]